MDNERNCKMRPWEEMAINFAVTKFAECFPRQHNIHMDLKTVF
jgi:hypothetical protein